MSDNGTGIGENGPKEVRYGDQLRAGERTDLGSYSLTSEEIVEYARQWDPQFFHIDADRAAAEGHFGGLIASGLQTLAVFQRLCVLGCFQQWHVIGGTGLDKVRFRRPVRPGDTLTGSVVIVNVQPEPDKARALVECNGELANQNGEQVLTLTMRAYVKLTAV